MRMRFIKGGERKRLMVRGPVSDDTLKIWDSIVAFRKDYYLNMQIAEYPTPEPASFALLGLGSLALLRRRKEAL